MFLTRKFNEFFQFKINKNFNFIYRLKFCDEHRAKVKLKPKINEFKTYNNKIKIPNSIVEDNFKKLIWDKKYTIILKEINIEQINFSNEINDDENDKMAFINNENYSKVDNKKDFLTKLYKIKILFKLLIKMNIKNQNFVLHKHLNCYFLNLFKILVNNGISKDLNLSIKDNNISKFDFFSEIILFFIDCNFQSKNYKIFINEQELNFLFSQINDKKNDVLKQFKDEENLGKNYIIGKFNFHYGISYEKYGFTITELLNVLITANIININNFKDLLENKLNLVFMNYCDILSKYKILYFLVDFLNDMQRVNFTITKYLKLENEISQNEISKNLNEKIMKTLPLEKNFVLIRFFQKIHQSLNLNSFIETFQKNELKYFMKIIIKYFEDIIKQSQIFAEKENHYFYNSYLLSQLIKLENSKEEINNIQQNKSFSLFFDFLEILNNNDNLIKIDSDIDFDNDYSFKLYLSIFKTFDFLFKNIHNKDKDNKIKKFTSYDLTLLKKNYFMMFEVFCKNLMKKILIRKQFTKYQTIILFKLQKINNLIFSTYDILDFNSDNKSYKFRLPILLSYLIRNSLKKLFKSSNEEIEEEEFKFFIFQIYLFHKNINNDQIKFFYDESYKNLHESDDYMILIEIIFEAINYSLPLFELMELKNKKQNMNILINFKEVLIIVDKNIKEQNNLNNKKLKIQQAIKLINKFIKENNN